MITLRQALSYACSFCQNPTQLKVSSDNGKKTSLTIGTTHLTTKGVIGTWNLGPGSTRKPTQLSINLDTNTFSVDFVDHQKYVPVALIQLYRKRHPTLCLTHDCSFDDASHDIELHFNYTTSTIDNIYIDQYLTLRDRDMNYVLHLNHQTNYLDIWVSTSTSPGNATVEVNLPDFDYPLSDPNILDHVKTALLFS